MGVGTGRGDRERREQRLAAYLLALKSHDVAVGFFKEVVRRIAGDKALDFEGMKHAALNAVEIYKKEIAGGLSATNLDDVVNRAMATAKEQVDGGRSALARATLRRAAAEMMRREQDERRERYVAGVTALHYRERDIALAAYDGEAAAQAMVALAETLHATNGASTATFLDSEAQALYVHGRDRGSNVHLLAVIPLRNRLLALASTGDERGAASTNLGDALATLGARESGTARLEEAVEAYSSALEEYTRERVPLLWAKTQNNLGLALWRLGIRDSKTRRLTKAVTAFRAALEVQSRKQVPLQWAATQNGLGLALSGLGVREGSTRLLEEAIACHRAALQEYERESTPLDRAAVQHNLGYALFSIGQRERGTTRLGAAVAAYHSALEEQTREKVPLDWARTKDNLGNALFALGQRESGTEKLEQAVAAYRAALEDGRTSGFRSRGRGRRTISALHLPLLPNEGVGRQGFKRRLRPTARRWRNGRASVFHFIGQKRSTISAMHM